VPTGVPALWRWGDWGTCSARFHGGLLWLLLQAGGSGAELIRVLVMGRSQGRSVRCGSRMNHSQKQLWGIGRKRRNEGGVDKRCCARVCYGFTRDRRDSSKRMATAFKLAFGDCASAAVPCCDASSTCSRLSSKSQVAVMEEKDCRQIPVGPTVAK
jgi:hypothetical protein